MFTGYWPVPNTRVSSNWDMILPDYLAGGVSILAPLSS